MILQKKILFVVPGCKHGGTNKSLQNLLEQLKSNSDFDIHVFAMNHDGIYNKIFKKFNLLDENYFVSSLLCTHYTKNFRGLILYFLRNIYRVLKIAGINLLNVYFKAGYRYLSSKYEYVIAFQEGEATHFTQHIVAKKKIAWVHSDIKSYLQLKNIEISNELKVYNQFNNIICVSKYTSISFESIFPLNNAKLNYLYNIVNVDIDKNICKNDTRFQIISVGRFDPIKRFSYIPEIALALRNKGLQFCWTIIGGGALKEIEHLTQRIKSLNLENEIIYLGEMENPYSTMVSSDLLVSLSSSEACPYVINEALSLHVPVLTTNYPSSYEFVNHNFNGMIVKFEEITETLSQLISNKEQYQNIKSGAQCFKWDNNQIIQNFNKILCIS